MSGYLLGADFGGSAAKITVLREDGCVLATATREYPTVYPQNGWTEQNPEELFAAFVETLQDIFSQGIEPERISAIAIMTLRNHPKSLVLMKSRSTILITSFLKPAHAWHIHHGAEVSAHGAVSVDADFVLTVFAVSHAPRSPPLVVPFCLCSHSAHGIHDLCRP